MGRRSRATTAPWSVRLSSELVDSATAAAATHFRSLPRQLEYWIELGRAVDRHIRPEQAARVFSGLAEFSLVPAAGVEPGILEKLDAASEDQITRETSQLVASSRVVYRPSTDHAGYLEEVHPNGATVPGYFRGSQFIPLIF